VNGGFFSSLLEDPYRPQLARYRRGLAEMDRYCNSNYGKPFPALTEEQQDTLLENLEAGKIKQVESGPQFFQLVRRHVFEGMFCEPHYGGNRNLIGWKLVGFPGQRYGYDDPYINRVVDLPPIAFNRPPRKGD
jgi:gluconate 2-dehydrogenase gamma chain